MKLRVSGESIRSDDLILTASDMSMPNDPWRPVRVQYADADGRTGGSAGCWFRLILSISEILQTGVAVPAPPDDQTMREGKP